MAYGETSEFPHAHLGDDERGHHELIMLYKDLIEKYSGTLDTITNLSAELSQFKKDMNSFLVTELDIYKKQVKQELVNNLIDWENDFSKSMDGKLTSYKAEVTSLLNDMKIEMLDFMEQTDDKLETMENTQTQFMQTASEQYEQQIKSMNKTITNFKKCVNGKIEELRNTLPLDVDLLKWIWDYAIGLGGYTALEWYNSGVTCEEWNASGITCVEWYTRGKYIFDWYSKFIKLFSPVSGEFVTVQDALVELALKLKINALTAEEYDKLCLTAQRVDELNMSMGEYDWAGELLYNMCSTVEQEER